MFWSIRPGRFAPILLVIAVMALGKPNMAKAGQPGNFDVPHYRRPDPAPLTCARTVCVHGHNSLAPQAQIVAAEAQLAWDTLVFLGWPTPSADPPLGGDGAFDIYLTAPPPRCSSRPCRQAPSDAAASYPDDTSAFATRGRARATSFGTLTLPRGEPPCALRSQAARVVAQASMLEVDPALHGSTLAMLSSHAASFVAPCSKLEVTAFDAFQRRPDLALNRAPRDTFSPTFLFSDTMDRRYGRGGYGSFFLGLIGAMTQPLLTPDEGLPAFRNEPDIYDGLTRIMPARSLQLSDALLDFHVARAFAGDRSDGQHGHATDAYGAHGRPRFEWSVPFDSLPRRLGMSRPIEATGAAYIWVDLPKKDPGKGLVATAVWEESFVFQFALVVVDHQGIATRQLRAGGVFGRNEAQKTVEDLSDAAGVLIVITHVGHDNRSEAFDPDAFPQTEPAQVLLSLHPG